MSPNRGARASPTRRHHCWELGGSLTPFPLQPQPASKRADQSRSFATLRPTCARLVRRTDGDSLGSRSLPRESMVQLTSKCFLSLSCGVRRSIQGVIEPVSRAHGDSRPDCAVRHAAKALRCSLLLGPCFFLSFNRRTNGWLSHVLEGVATQLIRLYLPGREWKEFSLRSLGDLHRTLVPHPAPQDDP